MMKGLAFLSNIKAGLDVIRSSKSRSLSMMLGIVIGVALIISVIAIGTGLKNQISSQIHHYGKNIIIVRASQLQFGSSKSNALSTLNITSSMGLKDIQTVQKVYGVAESAPLTLVPGEPSGVYGSNPQTFIIGTSSSLPSLINQSLAYGSFFSSSSNNNNGYVAVLGQNVATSLFKENAPLGSSFSFHGQTFVVDGVFNNFNATPLDAQANFNNAIFIPNNLAEALTNNTAPTYEILARASSATLTNVAASNIKGALNTLHGGVSNLSVTTGNQNLTSDSTILNLITSTTAGAAAISLLVAGIGIMNVMLVSVSERVREIGIRKAVGATNRQIRNQFIAEASFISLIGGILGVILAFLIDAIIRVVSNLTPDITWPSVVVSCGISLILGIVFGTLPAIKASRKDPIEALRAE